MHNKLRKALRVFLWLSGVLVLLGAGAAGWLRIQYPPQRLKRLALAKVSQVLNGRQVTCGEVRLRPFHGFRISDLSIADRGSGPQMARIRELEVEYRLLPLLRKQFVVHRILVREPWISVSLDKEGRTSLDDLIAPARDTTRAPRAELPLTVVLDRLDVQGAAAQVRLDQDASSTTFSIQGLSLRVSDLQVKSLDRLRARLELSSQAARWRLWLQEAQGTRLDVGSHLTVKLTVPAFSFERLTAETAVYLDSLCLQAPGARYQTPDTLAFRASVVLNLDQGTLALERFHLAFGPWLALNGRAQATSLAHAATIDLALDSLTADLGRMVRGALDAGLPGFVPKLSAIQLEGSASLEHGYVRGPLAGPWELGTNLRAQVPSLSVPDLGLSAQGIAAIVEGLGEGAAGQGRTRLRAKLDIGRITHAPQGSGRTAIEDLGLNLSAEALWDSARGMLLPKAAVQARIRRAVHAPDSAQALEATGISVTADPTFSGALLPNRLDLGFSVERVLDGSAQGSLVARFDKPSLRHLMPDAVQGAVTATGLAPEAWTDSALTGHYNLDLRFDERTLDDVAVTLQAESQDAAYLLGGAYQPLPLEARIQARLGVSSDLSDLTVHRFDAQAFGALTVSGTAQVLGRGAGGVRLVIDRLELEHAQLPPLLPAAVRAGLGDLVLGGATSLTGTLEGVLLPGGRPQLRRAHAAVRIRDAQAKVPRHYLSASGLNGAAEVRAGPDSVDAWVDMVLDSLERPGLLRDPLADSKLRLTAALRTRESRAARDFSGRLDVWADLPGLGTQVRTECRITRTLGGPVLSASADLRFAASDTVRLLADLWATGDADLQARVDLPDGNLAEVSGVLGLEGLSAGVGRRVAVEGLQGRVLFAQGLDVRQRRLATAPVPQQVLPTGAQDLSYALWQPYFPRASRVHADRVRVMGYQVTDVDADVDYHGSVLDVPRFALNAYDGNVAGRLRADVGAGNPREIAYAVKAQLADINSAKLPMVRQGGQQASGLSANLEFVGKGVDPRAAFDVEGSLHITKIERRVAENLLALLDPKETDKSIQSVRKLLHQGWGVRSFSFVTKHGFVYPSIEPVKPWYAPFRLPKSLEFSRMPLKFFVERTVSR